MVERYYAPVIELMDHGTLVLHSDYAALQVALKESLDGWEGFAMSAVMTSDWPGWKRITELRKLLT